MNKKKIIIVLLFIAAIAAFFAFDLGRFFSLSYLKQSQDGFAQLYAQKPALVIGAFLDRKSVV